MKKNDFSAIKLTKGEIDIYDFGRIGMHVYRTNDAMNDISFLFEKDGRAFVLEPPCFKVNLEEFERYIRSLGFKVEGLVTSYHNTGAGFVKEAPRYTTRQAEDYGMRGRGKEAVANFVNTFGDAFDGSLNPATDYIDGDSDTIAGIRLDIERDGECFDIVLPEINAKYIHMLGHDVHSIVSDPAQARADISKLEKCVKGGYDLILTSHYPPEDLKDAKAKIAYLKKLLDIADKSDSPAAFSDEMEKKYPNYTGEHYLGMTSRMLFEKR